jgi:putative drug exporter of the RND superfamily
MLKLARLSYRRRGWVVAAWIVLLLGVSVVSSATGGVFKNDFLLSGAESTAAFDFLEARGFGDRAGFTGQIVFEADHGVGDPAVQETMESAFAEIETTVDDVQLVSPYNARGANQIAESGQIAYAEVNLADRPDADVYDAADEIEAVTDNIDAQGLHVELGGDLFKSRETPASEAIGIMLAIVVLLVAFGSVLAAGLPIMTALFGVGIGIALVQLVANGLTMPDFTTQAVAMIGIGVGIDYALLIVTRYRQALSEGRDPENAVLLALDTAGRSVALAGSTVVIAVLGMLLIDAPAIRGLAIGIALGVLMTMLAAVTLLPAVLGFTGRNIDRLGLPHRKRAEADTRESFWHRWSHAVQRRPWAAAACGLVVLVVLSLPVLSMRLAFTDAGNRPQSDTTRQAYDMLAKGFGVGFNGPLLLAADLPGGRSDLEALGELSATLNETPGVELATEPFPNEAGDAAIFQVFPTTSPQSEETAELVDTLRDDVVAAAEGGTTLDVKVGGRTAAVVDYSAYTTERLPVFIGAVLVLSFLLLMVVFRSLLVPLKAVIVNLLSIGAAYGAMVAAFQWGWGKDLLGFSKAGPIEAWAPMLLFAIVFGLSMDYEVFLLSRIREEYDRTGSNNVAVAHGLATTARVITAAALIMVCVFGAFVLGSDPAIKLFGFGLAFAVALDATVVRLIVVPATMELLGDKNWWLPRWLDRILPRVKVDVVEDELDRELQELEPAAHA